MNIMRYKCWIVSNHYNKKTYVWIECFFKNILTFHLLVNTEILCIRLVQELFDMTAGHKKLILFPCRTALKNNQCNTSSVYHINYMSIPVSFKASHQSRKQKSIFEYFGLPDRNLCFSLKVLYLLSLLKDSAVAFFCWNLIKASYALRLFN